MDYVEHKRRGISVVEVVADGVIVASAQDLLDIISDFSVKKIILRKENLSDAFFDLRTGFAGEILQKASNYRISIGIVGDFSKVDSRSLRDFIYESNETKQIVFKGSVEEVLSVFCRS